GTQLFADILNARCGVGASVGEAYTDLFPQSQIPTNCFDPVAANILKKYVPCPNTDPSCANIDPNNTDNIYRAVPNDQSHANQFTVKIDHKINDKQNLVAYYYFNDSFDGQPFTRFQALTPNQLPGFGNDNKFRSQQVNLTHTWTLNTSTVNEARATYFREAQGTFLHPQRTDLVTNSCDSSIASICFTGTTDVPSVIPPDPRLGITPGL